MGRQLNKRELKLLDIFVTHQTRYALHLQTCILQKQRQFERSGIWDQNGIWDQGTQNLWVNWRDRMETSGGLYAELCGISMGSAAGKTRVLQGSDMCFPSPKKKSPSCRNTEFVLYSWESFEKAKHVCWPFPQRKYSLWKLIILAGIPFFLLRRVKWSYGSVRGHLYNTEEEFPKLQYSPFIWRRPGQIGFLKHFLY